MHVKIPVQKLHRYEVVITDTRYSDTGTHLLAQHTHTHTRNHRTRKPTPTTKPDDGFLGGEHDHAHAQRQVHNERVLQVKEEGDVLQVLAVSEACNKES